MKPWPLFATLLGGSLTAHAAEVVPYLQAPTPHAITVNWLTDEPGSPVVHFGSQADALTATATGTSTYISGGGEDFYYHTVRLEGLDAQTFYHYRVESGNDDSDVYRFRTQPEAGTANGIYRVLVLGDHQLRDQPRYLELVKRARAKVESLYGTPFEEAINLCLNVGDQVDVGTPDHYRNIHFARSEPISGNVAIQTTVGNHETYGTPGISLYSDLFDYLGYSYQGVATGTDRYYAYQFANILFVHTDSEIPNATQTQWVSQVAAAAATDPNVSWIVSLVHRPYQAEQYVGDISSWFRTTAMPTLNQTGKHALNLGAHHHLYARGQVRDNPTYHLISGGTAWDQFWGQSTEKDFDDVTKTIANWAWQVIEFDLNAGTMKVDSYAEGHPLLGFVYDSKHIDSFTRKLGVPAPEKPSIETSLPMEPVELPLTLTSSAFASTSAETLYATQFQIAKAANFSAETLEVDLIRDLENIYGDTGAPAYEPVDIHAGVNIREYAIPTYGLHNGTHYVRVRHRDSNIEWSAWSDAVPFTVTGSTDADPSLQLSRTKFSTGEPVTVTYKDGRGATKDWIGVYRKGQNPQSTVAQAFAYVDAQNARNGSVTFENLPGGYEYFAGFFSDDGYEEMAERVSFYVGQTPTLTTEQTAYSAGEDVTIQYTGAPGGAKDWIGIYRMGHVPGPTPSTKWAYTPKTEGSVTFSGLADGFYFIVYFINDGYTEVSERVTIQIGDAPAVVATAKTRFEVGETFPITFSGGAGTAKDYIGVFDKNAVNLGELGEELVAYQYIGGVPTGSIEFNQPLPKGQYFLALFINDSYTEISNRIYFGVGEDYVAGPSLKLEKTTFELGEAIVVQYAGGPGLAKDWVGIYAAGDQPGGGPLSKAFAYVNAANPANGTLTLTDALPAGDYFVAFFTNDGYAEIAPRIPFSVVATTPALSLETATLRTGDPVVIHYENGPGNAKDWIGLYRADQTPGSGSPWQSWGYVQAEHLTDGSLSLPGNLPEGDYYAAFFSNDSYTEIAPRISFAIRVPFASRVADWATASGLTTGTNAGTQDDPDGDGLANLIEYALGNDPLDPDGLGQPVLALQDGQLEVTFRRRVVARELPELKAAWTQDFVTWTEATIGTASSATNGVRIDIATGTEFDTITVTIPTTDDQPIYARLLAIAP